MWTTPISMPCRCLIVGLSALRKTQKGFDAAVLAETCEAVFDATACYFPVTFTPPPNDPHNISPDALRTGALVNRRCYAALQDSSLLFVSAYYV